MSDPPVVVRADTLTSEARVLAAEHGMEALPVIDTEGRLVGVVRGTDRLDEAHMLRGARSTVADVMTSPAISMSPDATVGRLAQAMLANQLRFVPIVEDGELIGIVDRNDLLATLVHDDNVITSSVRALLREYAGLRRWGVQVVAGVVTVSGAFVDRADRGVVVSLVRMVPGVVAVELRMEHPITTGWAG